MYAKVEESSEVVDVLYAIVLGSKTPKEIEGKLRQSDVKVRQKLLFLRQSKVVNKDKWEYTINWVVLSRKMLNVTKELMEHYIGFSEGKNKKGLEEIKNNLKEYFPKPLLVGIFKSYSMAYFKGYEKLSLGEMMKTFLKQLRNIEDKKLKSLNKNLLELKNILKDIPSKEQELFSGLFEDIES